jgi:hypothetical protein
MTKNELKQLIRECLREELARHKSTLKESLWSCYFDDRYVGTVEATTEEAAKEKMMDKYPEYQYSLYDGCFWVEPEEDALTESSLKESRITDSEVREVLRDAEDEAKRWGTTDEFPIEYYIGSSVSAAHYPLNSLYIFLPDHVSTEDKEYKDAVRGWKENLGLDPNERLPEEAANLQEHSATNEPGYYADMIFAILDDLSNDEVYAFLGEYPRYEALEGECIADLYDNINRRYLENNSGYQLYSDLCNFFEIDAVYDDGRVVRP